MQVLIYVFDVESADTEKDMNHFMGVLEVRRIYPTLALATTPQTKTNSTHSLTNTTHTHTPD
jgi:hypothetical protein